MAVTKCDVRIFSREAMRLAASILALAGLLLFLSAVRTANAADQPSEVSYPAKDFQNGNARFYSYQAANGVAVKYFVIKSADGVIRAAYDACDVCFEAKKGYEQKGDFMVCRNCGRRFATNRINEVQGGCNPAPLAREIRGDKVVFKVKDILEGKRYFDSGKGSGK